MPEEVIAKEFGPSTPRVRVEGLEFRGGGGAAVATMTLPKMLGQNHDICRLQLLLLF